MALWEHVRDALPLALAASLLCSLILMLLSKKVALLSVLPRVAATVQSARGAWSVPVSALICVLLLALTFGLQTTIHFALRNDHAGYLAMARQIVLGELPIRDFFEHGAFLQVVVSAALQMTFGHHILAEMVLCFGLLGLGYCVTFLLASSLARSSLTGCLLTLSSVLAAPRPYSYPKILIYPVAIWLIWNYVRRPSARNVAILGCASAIALMVRVEHGVVMLASAALIVLLRNIHESPKQPLRSLWLLLLYFGLGMSPFLVYLMLTVGIVNHFAAILEFGERALARSDLSLLVAYAFTGKETGLQMGRGLMLYAYVFITAAAMIMLLWRLWSDARLKGRLGELTCRLMTVMVVWLTATPMLLRDGFSERFPDVAPIMAILGAGVVGGAFEHMSRESTVTSRPFSLGRVRTVGRWMVAPVVVALLLVPSIMLHGNLSGVLAIYPRAVRNLGNTLRRYAADPPREVLTRYREIIRYANECTMANDRLLVTWYAPEIYFAANRRFAGNQWLYADFQNSAAQQYAVLRRMMEQSIPLVFYHPENEGSLENTWPLLANHLTRQYATAGSLDGIRVYVDRQRASLRTDSQTGLPCFAPSRAGTFTGP